MNQFFLTNFNLTEIKNGIKITNLNNNTNLYNEALNNDSVRNMNIIENKTSWKKCVSDKLVRRMMRYREDRIDNLRLNKEDILNEVRYEEMIVEMNDQESQILSDYFDRVKYLIDNNSFTTGEYELEFHKNSLISICPICSYPVILTTKKILCLNLCFEFIVHNNFINENFSLDNFVDILGRTYREHQNCFRYGKYNFQLLIFDDNFNIVCEKCFYEYLS
jgi:hypothetical protein